MRPFALVSTYLLFFYSLSAQVYQGLVVPDAFGRWGNTSPITQSSGLAKDSNPGYMWTHNDQGNPTTELYKFQPAVNNQAVQIVKTVSIRNTTNLDWEDLAQDEEGNIYICQIGKNCNANSDPMECPTRFIFKIHKVSLASLYHPDSTEVTPETYYFRYPLSGYDLNNCDSDDTVFVNSEAAVFKDGGIYLFSKNIWSKYTNNCGGWIEGYTYMFKVELTPGSSMSDPITATYIDKFNLKRSVSDVAAKYQVTGADLNDEKDNLALITYGRVWQFKDFEGDDFFSGSASYVDYSDTGTDTITRGYEGVVFIARDEIILGVDGVNGRISRIHADELRNLVWSKADQGPGSLRNAIAASGSSDTIRFDSSIHQKTIELNSALVVNGTRTIEAEEGSQIRVNRIGGPALTCLEGAELTLQNLIFSGTGNDGPVISNQGEMVVRNVILEKH